MNANELQNISKKDLDLFLKEAEEAAIKAGKYSLKFFGKPNNVKNKGRTDLVTEVDIKSESIIKNALAKKFKDFGFFGEESENEVTKKDFTWIVDPIDGTSNFVHGYPFYCVSIGLAYKDEPILGVIYAPITDTVYKAHIKTKAFKNKKAIEVSKTKKLIESIIITGFYYNVAIDEKFLEDRMNNFQNMVKNSQGIRRDGSAALDMCMMAEGAADGFYEYGLAAWDICAGYIIVKQAGGTITDINNEYYNIYSRNQLIASNSLIHKEMIKVLTQN